MSNFNNYKLFKNVGIRGSDNKLIVMNVNKSNNVSFYSSDGGTNNIDVMSINSLINKSQNEDLNLSSLNGTTINPVITINNNHNDCRIMTNLNVYGNVNITKNLNVSNTVVNHNLIIPKYDNNNSLLSNVIGSIYYNTTENMYEGYSNEGWQPLGGFSKTKDAIIHKNINVLQNINCTDKITSNVNIINHNLIIPKHNKDSILLSNTLGSIYYNTTENMYEGYSNEGWQPLGGFSKSKDATIYKNLNVLGNLNITGNMNQINSTQITVNDKNIVLASNNNADNHAEDGGIILQGATQKSLLWKSANGWKSSEKITAPHLDTVANQLLIGNTQVGLNLNFSGNNLHINGNIPKAGQVLIGTNSEVKWADTDYTLVNNQLIKVITETIGEFGEFKPVQSPEYLHLNTGTPNYTETYTAHDGYILNNDTKKIIIIFNFAVFDSNLVSKIKLELWVGNTNIKEIIFKNMTGNQINDFVKYFTLTSTQFGTGSKEIKFVFIDMNNTGTIKIFTNNGTNPKQPTITLQEIGDQNIKTILDETRGSKSDQIAKILVNTNATATTQILNTSQTTNYVYPYELHSSYTPSVSDTGTIIIIVNFALYISFNNNLTSKLKLELLLNNGSDTTIPQERKIILQEMNSNRSYEYTKYFSISKTAFGTGNKIELRFTDMNNSGNITLFTNDNSNVKQPVVTIQEIGSTTGWGSSIENIPIGQTISADGSFNKVVVKNNLNVSGNLNVINDVTINARLGIGTTSNRTTLDVGGTDGIIIPVGTEALRPANPIPGTIRYNSETYNFEGYSGFGGGVWISLSALPPNIELALLGGGGGGGDGNAPGGGGGAGGLVEASGTFPLNVPFILQLGGGGIGPNEDNSGSAGHMTQLTTNGFDLRAYGGGFGGSYATAANTIIDGTRNGGSGGGGAGPSPSTGSTSGATAGPLGDVNINNIVSDLQTAFFGGNGSDYWSTNQGGYFGGGGHGGGVSGNSSNTMWAPAGRAPVGKTSGVDLWSTGNVTMQWGGGGNGAKAGTENDMSGIGEIASLDYIGNGGAGSFDRSTQGFPAMTVRHIQHGNIGGAIINVPAGIFISITGSNNNMETQKATVNGGTSYIFYDNRFKTTTGENSGSFTITLHY